MLKYGIIASIMDDCPRNGWIGENELKLNLKIEFEYNILTKVMRNWVC